MSDQPLAFPVTRWLCKGPSPTGVSQNDVQNLTETVDFNCKPNGYGGSVVQRHSHFCKVCKC